MGPNWVDHFIDFWVILFADVAAAYIALTWFESMKEERELRKRSLNQLIILADMFLQKYLKWYEGMKDSSDSTGTGLSKDLSDEDRKFAGLANDGAFWSFKCADRIRPTYESAKALKDNLNARTVGEAKLKLTALIEELKKLKMECYAQMTSKPFRRFRLSKRNQ